jgi:hypothetical protein
MNSSTPAATGKIALNTNILSSLAWLRASAAARVAAAPQNVHLRARQDRVAKSRIAIALPIQPITKRL